MSSLRTAVLGLTLALLAGPAAGQKLLHRDLPANHPKNDPYTRGEPEVMEAAGILSHGGFEIGETDSTAVEELLGTCDIRWLETEHFELGFALGPYRVPPKEKKAYQAELLRLASRLPEVDPKAKQLDPWLRAHLTAMRIEDLYDEFLQLVRVDPTVFPDGSEPWDTTGTYHGEGPHLGQKGKFEVLVLPSEAAHRTFLNAQFGLQIGRSQRWNVVHRDSLTLNVHTQEEGLRSDRALHAHLAFNLAHNFLNGFEHYTYESPIWLLEGLAHWMERRVSPDFNTFDGGEGSIPERSRKSDWEGAVRKLVTAGGAPPMARLVRLQGFGQLSLQDHFAVWSMIDYLHRTRPGGLAAFLQALKGRTNEAGYGDGSEMLDYHREIFREHLGTSYSEFDRAWAEWVQATY